MNEKEFIQLTELKENMVLAESLKEVRYYEKLIHQFLNRVDPTVKKGKKLSGILKEKHNELLEKMMNADTAKEVNNYAMLLHDFLDHLQPAPKQKMNPEDQKELQELIEKMNDAVDVDEVLYYDKKIHQLLTKNNFPL